MAVLLPDRDLVEPLDQIKLAEDEAPSRTFVKVWQRVAVPDRGLVESAVVAAQAPAAILLPNHVKRRGPRCLGSPADAGLTHHGEVFLGHLELLRGQPPRGGLDWRPPGLNETFYILTEIGRSFPDVSDFRISCQEGQDVLDGRGHQINS